MKKNNYRALFVSYFFPPLGGAGVYRSLKFCKYLPEWGWATDVISAHASNEIHDDSLLSQIPSQTRVYRPKNDIPNYTRLSYRLSHLPLLWRLNIVLQGVLGFPDNKRTWAKLAYKTGLKIFRSGQTDLIYTTFNPYAAHQVGLWLKCKTGLPWVADYRDPWSDGPLHMAGLPDWIVARHRRLEHRVAITADHHVFAHPQIAQAFRERHGLPLHKVSCITNGFDPEDFVGWSRPSTYRQRIHIVHLGTFYGPYNPNPLKRALLLAKEKYPNLAESIKLVFVGGTPVSFEDIPGLKIEVMDRVSHHEALRQLQDADIALNVYESSVGKHNISGKLFEYLASERPILAIVPKDGATANIVRTCRAGFVADPDEPDAILSALKKSIEVSRGKLPFQPNREEIEKFSRFRLAGELSKIFNKVVSNNFKTSKQI